MVADLEGLKREGLTRSEPMPAAAEEGVRLTPEQLRRRRARSIAIGLALGALVLLFWAVTIVKLGGNVANRSL